MQKLRRPTLFKAFAGAGAFFALIVPATPAPRSAPAFEPRMVIITLLGGAQREEQGELTMAFNANDLTGVSYKTGQVRHRGFAIVDRTRQSSVACDPKEAEYGSVRLKDGSWIAVAVCPANPSATAIAIPSLIRARASANEASATMSCWENKELRMGVCVKIGSDPAARPMPQTREHILLARQVGVPGL
jgi:hypothetical protein